MKPTTIFKTATTFIFVAVMMLSTCAMSQTVGKSDANSIKARYNNLKNQLDIARYQWYDLYAEGVMIKAG